MNGRIARALCHLKSGHLNIRDVGLLQRRMQKTQDNLSEPKALVVRARTPAQAHGATWPHTPDQKKQGRPMIVLSPLSHIAVRIRETYSSISNLTNGWVETKSGLGTLPKHVLDRMAQA